MKTLIVGMNNPLSSDPAHALYPTPQNCAGARLWRMLHEAGGHGRGDYVRAFDRRNLVSGRLWSRPDAAEAGRCLVNEAEHNGRIVVALGAQVQRALGLTRRAPPLGAVRRGGATYRCVPHPSGRSRFYNEEYHKLAVGLLMEELAQ